MLALAFLKWWYGPGWLKLLRTVEAKVNRVGNIFSVRLLLQTLFSPWRRIISYGNRSFIEGLRAMLDNLISRLVGFSVRFLVLLAAGFTAVLTLLLGGISLLAWPLLPILALVAIVRGVLAW